MSWYPRPGTALVRPIQAATTFPGGRIQLLPDTIERLTAQQVELVRMGPPAERDEPEPWQADLDAALQSLPEGAWLLVKPRSWIEGTRADELFIAQDAIVAQFP